MSGIKDIVVGLSMLATTNADAVITSENIDAPQQDSKFFTQVYCNTDQTTCYTMFMKQNNDGTGNFALNIKSTDSEGPYSLEPLRHQFGDACKVEISASFNTTVDQDGGIKITPTYIGHADCTAPAAQVWEELSGSDNSVDSDIRSNIGRDIKTVQMVTP